MVSLLHINENIVILQDGSRARKILNNKYRKIGKTAKIWFFKPTRAYPSINFWLKHRIVRSSMQLLKFCDINLACVII